MTVSLSKAMPDTVKISDSAVLANLAPKPMGIQTNQTTLSLRGGRWSLLNIEEEGIYAVWPDSLFAPVKHCRFLDIPPYFHLHV